VTSSLLPRHLPVTVPPAQFETVASYLARLATLNGLDGDDLWRQATLPRPTPRRRTPDPWLLSALTGRRPGHLAGALLELRDPRRPGRHSGTPRKPAARVATPATAAGRYSACSPTIATSASVTGTGSDRPTSAIQARSWTNSP
jgi:hypothetical protein